MPFYWYIYCSKVPFLASIYQILLIWAKEKKKSQNTKPPNLLKISATVFLNLWDTMAFISLNVFHTTNQNNLPDWILNIMPPHLLSCCYCKSKCLLLLTINLVLNISKVNTRECDCCELLWIKVNTNSHVHLVPCLLHHFPALAHGLLVLPLYSVLSRADQSQRKFRYHQSLNKVWIQPNEGNLTADSTLENNKIPMHWLQFNLALLRRRLCLALNNTRLLFIC